MKKSLRSALAVHVGIVAILIPILVRVFPLKKLLEVFTPSALLRPYRSMSADDMASVVRNRLNRPVWMVRRACLREGLLMFHFLRLAGLEATFHISVYPRDAFGRLHAHCWITSYGKTVSSPPDAAAAEVLSYPVRS